MSLEPDLRAGAAALGLALSDEQAAKLLQYLELLQKWGKVYNLTAVRDPVEMLSHHLLDSLAIVAPLREQIAGKSARLLDVGSGAGLPGTVIAICCPEVQVDCLDAVAKKAAFVQQVAGTLRLPNLRGIHGRVERVSDAYDVVSSRAFASLADFVTGSRAALAPDGVWLAMKGKRPDAEIAELGEDVDVFHVEQLAVPALDAERCIVWMRVRAER
jgi:16S rRNA (guanine527-N7)-methyltransferase